jgi:hypothetical protein
VTSWQSLHHHVKCHDWCRLDEGGTPLCGENDSLGTEVRPCALPIDRTLSWFRCIILIRSFPLKISHLQKFGPFVLTAMKFQSTFALASVTTLASAHTIFTQLQSGGTLYRRSKGRFLCRSIMLMYSQQSAMVSETQHTMEYGKL